jgi:hypothetical protein
MAIGSFEGLCAGFCEIISVSPPALSEDAQGLCAFNVVWRGVTVNLVHCPRTSPDHIFAVFELGPVETSGSRSLADMRTLLEANFVLLRVHAPAFSRNPATGDAVLQYVYSLFDATPQGLYQLIEEGVDWVSQWQERPCSGEAADMPTIAANGSSTAMPNFA